MYEFLLALHILTAVIWVGGSASLLILAGRVARADDPERLAFFASEIEYVGRRVFLPASIVLLLAGIGLVLDGGWEFTDLWIAIGFAGILFSIVTGAAFLGPESGRIAKLTKERGIRDSEVQRRIKRAFLVSRVELVVLLLVVVDMAVKPGV